MSRIRCIITDDEPLARKGLQGYVEKTPYLELISQCEDALQLGERLKIDKVDLVFLDIELPFISGIDFLKKLSYAPKVILITAYEDYALEGFELDVIDYLLKPVSFERFSKATRKAADYFAAAQFINPAYFFVKSDGRLEKVVFSDILFIEAMENYVGIYTTSRKLIVHATFKSIQLQLPEQFVQTHKSYLVNPVYVTSIETNELSCSGYKIPISKYQKENALVKIVNNRLLKKG